jgi:hypothetical protein
MDAARMRNKRFGQPVGLNPQKGRGEQRGSVWRQLRAG